MNEKENHAALKWLWSHTKLIVNILSVLYVANWVYCCVVIIIAIQQTATFSYLDTLIAETNETFRIVVGVNMVKACVENVFKYNDFGKKDKAAAGEEPEEIEMETDSEDGGAVG